VVFVTALPLGLGRVAAAGPVARGLLLGGALDVASESPLALLWARVVAFVPVGPVAWRVHLASSLAAALALGLSAAVAMRVLMGLLPRTHARTTAEVHAHIAPAVVGAAAAVGMTLAFFRPATLAGPVALSAAGVSLCSLLLLRVLRDPESHGPALTLAFVAGMGAGLDPAVAAVIWPPGALLWLWCLRRGARWPLVAPLVFVAGWGTLFALAAISPGYFSLDALMSRLSLGVLWRALAGASGSTAGVVAQELTDELGVVASVLGVVGLVVLGLRAPAAASLVVYGGWASLMIASASAPGEATAAVPRAFLVTLAIAPIAAGVAFVAEQLGRARQPAAVTLAVIAAVSPALDGGLSRWKPEARLADRLLERAADRAGPRGTLDPGGDEMAQLFSYGHALAVRPDIEVRAARGAQGKMPRSR
jgi:hypothetical protein